VKFWSVLHDPKGSEGQTGEIEYSNVDNSNSDGGLSGITGRFRRNNRIRN